MTYEFINHNKHSISVPGPNKEMVRISPGITKTLPDYFLKYCPKYLKVVKKLDQNRELDNRIAQKRKRISINNNNKRLSRNRSTSIQMIEQPSKNIIPVPNVSNISIGILSCNRLHCVKRLLESIKKFSPDNINVIVSDESTDQSVKNYLRSLDWITLLDHKERKGVVHNTNALLKATSPYEYKLLLNDDVEILKYGWESFYFKAMTETNFHHFLYREISLYGANHKDESISKINQYEIKTIKLKPQGAVMAFDQFAFEKIGYYDTKFPKYGMAHVDWSNRVSISKIQPIGFHDVTGSNEFFKIHSEKTVDENKSKNLVSAKKIYDLVSKNINRIYVGEKIDTKILMWINTYNRPTLLKDVLDDIIKNKKNHNIKILIFDDGSNKNYSKTINEAALYLNIQYEKVNHCGKEKYWMLCNIAMDKIKKENAEYYYWIPDDVKLCDDFFDVSMDMWEKIEDNKKICLNPLMDKGREGKANWTGKLPNRIQYDNYKLWKIHWMDCCGVMKKNFFESIGYNIPEISPSRWHKKPNRSSGVGEYISKTLDPKFSFYQSQESLLKHGHCESVMNSNERRINPLKTEVIFDEKTKTDSKINIIPKKPKVIFSMATMPSRIKLLKQVIDSIYNQADVINLYLNNFQSIPDFLLDNKININMSKDYGDLGDAGKFYCCENLDGYHLTIDDDILYPPNYAQILIDGIEKYNKKYLVGIHASIIRNNFIDYRKSRIQYHCKAAMGSDTPVHMLGTGTLGYHTSTISLKRDIFKYPNMADTWLSKYCQENHVGCIALKRSAGWIKLLDVPLKDTIYGQGVGGRSESWIIQNKILKQIKFKIYGVAK